MRNLLPAQRDATLLPSIDDFHKWVDRFFSRSAFPLEWAQGEFNSFPVDLRENAKEFILDIEIPGIKKENIKITLAPDNRTLCLQGSKNLETEKKEENFHYRQRQSGNFNYQCELPLEVDPNSINARYDAGVLHLNLPKAKNQNAQKQIPIQ